MTPIFDIVGNGLGDVWSGLNYHARASQRTNTPVYVSTKTRSYGLPGNGDWVDTRKFMEQILNLLAIPSAWMPRLVDEVPTASCSQDCWGAEYFPTILRWHGSAKHVCYQFDGISSAADKNPSLIDVQKFHDWAEESGVKTVFSGKPLSLAACVEALAGASLFVGSCSGVSHVAHSVGVPMHLLEYKLSVPWWHRGNPRYTLHHGMQAFISHVAGQFPPRNGSSSGSAP